MVLSLVVTTPLITLVMDGHLLTLCFGNVCFDMLKSIGFGETFFKFETMSKDSLGLRFYWLLSQHWVARVSQCWDLYASPDCTIQLFFSWSFSSLFQHVDLVTTS